jgi:carboxyl-terminal processing protease
VLAALEKRFYRPEKLNDDWRAAVERHRPLIEAADTADGFEQSMSDLLAELHTSHLGFFHGSARRASSRAALSATYLADETPFGKRWIFQDVHSGGAASNAGIEPGDILLSVDGREITPPEHPVFAMGKQTSLEIVGRDDQRRAVAVDVARPKGKKLHFVEPTLVEARHLEDGLGYLKVAMFPGMVGVEVANEISRAVEGLGKDRQPHHRPPREYRRRDRSPSRHEPAHARQDSGRVRPRQKARHAQSGFGEAAISAIPCHPRFQEGALAARIEVCAGNAGQDAHRA